VFACIAILVVALSGLFVSLAHAQSRLDPVVITATKVETPASRLGASVTVVTEDEIREQNLTQIEEVLRNVPGVEVLRQGGPGKLTTVRIRGSSAAQTQVMIDGLRVKSPTSGQFDFADLGLDGVERIEVVRGPGSVLYGTNAFAGVINVVTKQPEQIVAEGKRLGVPTPFNEAIVREVMRHGVGTLQPDPKNLEPIAALLPR
jgi:outer membrane cobalamin receptor